MRHSYVATSKFVCIQYVAIATIQVNTARNNTYTQANVFNIILHSKQLKAIQVTTFQAVSVLGFNHKNQKVLMIQPQNAVVMLNFKETTGFPLKFNITTAF